MKERLRAPLAVLAGPLLLWAGCLSEPDVGRASSALEDGCTRLGATLLGHGCFHAEFGPFVTVAASPTRDFAAASPNINPVHTHYTVTLPGVPGMPGMNEGTIKYRPGRSGDWAILARPDIPLRVLDAQGNSVPVLLRHDVTASECAFIAGAHVVQLTGGQTYRLVFGPSNVASVGIVLEKLSDFEAFVFADSDGDGFGDPENGRSTACVAPAGHVTDDTDCVDADPAVFPGAAEVCDGTDNDCDGTVDEDAGTRFYADSDGDGDGNVEVSVVACVAPPGYVAGGSDCDDSNAAVHSQEHEVCDGLDNDCDGEVDNLPDPIGEVVEHACLHAQHGPFTTIDAVEPGAAGAPDVSAPHTAYKVDLVDAGGAFIGDVVFTPGETTDFAILVDPDVPVVVLDAGGNAIEVEQERAITTCPALARVSVIELEAGVTYRFHIGPTAAAQALLLIEEAAHEHDEDGAPDEPHEPDDSGATAFFADRDGDGFGDPGASIEACAAPAGYVANDGDCDDASSALHPGALDVCDGLDNDCDGLTDVIDGHNACACDDVAWRRGEPQANRAANSGADASAEHSSPSAARSSSSRS